MKLRFDEDRHAYYLDGKRCKSVTTVAKIPDDTYSLDLWRRRQTAIGLAMSPPLVERAAAHVDDKKILDALCEEAMTVAGAHQAAGRGTAAHRITETVDAGGTVIETELSRQVAATWRQLLDDAGLTVMPELAERIVVYPEWKICGKFDRIMRTHDGRNVIVDLKTGARAVDYPHSIAVQLALYANAELLAGPVDWRGETETFGPMPEIDLDHGYVVHLPEDGRPGVHEIDIDRGWRMGAETAFAALEWRSVRDLVTKYEPEFTLPDPGHIDAYRLELLDRIQQLRPSVQGKLRDAWPDGYPSLKNPDGWDQERLDHIATSIRVLRGFPLAKVEPFLYDGSGAET